MNYLEQQRKLHNENMRALIANQIRHLDSSQKTTINLPQTIYWVYSIVIFLLGVLCGWGL